MAAVDDKDDKHDNDISNYALRLEQALGHLGRADWSNTLADLLACYLGLEQLVDDEAGSPLAQLVGLAESLNDSPDTLTDEAFATAIAELPFFAWRIRTADSDGKPMVWHPLAESLADFVARGLVCWQYDLSTQERQVIAEALLIQKRRTTPAH